MKIDGLPDADARHAIREALQDTLIVEAAAGTGKTTELVQRVVAVLEGGLASMDSVVAVTFTEKAAGEMKLRLRAELERALVRAQNEDARTRLQAAILGLEGARIGTVHGFCHDLLRERPVEAGVDPAFEVLDTGAAQRLFARVFDDFFEENLEHPPEGLARVLRRAGGKGDGLRSALRRAAWDLVETRDFDAPFRRDPFDRRAALDRAVDAISELGALAHRALDPDDYLARALARADRFARGLRRREKVADRDYDALEGELRELTRPKHKVFSWKGRGRAFADDLTRDEVLAQRDGVEQLLNDTLRTCEADLAACLREDLWPLVARYERSKAVRGSLDFFDLLLCTRRLLVEHGGVRRELCARFSHLYVDEFQDTDPVQTEILLLLSSADPSVREPWKADIAPGKLFLVGDPKQSIYRFRRADPKFYTRVKAALVQAGARVVTLTTSFRSRPGVQQLVNATFAERMREDLPGSCAYVPLSPFRQAHPAQPSVVALPVPEPYAPWGKLTGRAIGDSTPDAVGAYVQWLVQSSGWKVREGADDVPLAPRHVCLLFRRTSAYGRDVVRDYVRALEARHIPHARAGGRSFHAREEVLAMRTALEAIEWPDDALSVYATLRGPFFALSDHQLLSSRQQFSHLHPLGPVDDDALSESLREVAEALSVLGRLHVMRNRRPVHQTLRSLLTETRAHAGIAIWPTGEQALGNVLRLLELSRHYETRDDATSFRGFVEWQRSQAEQGDSEEAAVIEEGDDGVRMLTVHAAKGLEFPVVILCDPTAPLQPERPSRFVDPERALWARALLGLSPAELNEREPEVLAEDEAEEVRLCYVAATRARELLVVPVVGDHKIDDAEPLGWVGAFAQALFPPREARRSPEAAPGCPTFGDDSVFARPDKAPVGARASVAPGQHTPMRGDHRVVFWDPSCLPLGAKAIGGVRQQELLVDDGKGVARGRLDAFQRWHEAKRQLCERAATPSVVAAPATSLAAARSAPPRDVRVERCEREPNRPTGARFGSLVHALLEHVREADPGDTRERLAASLARALGATEQERGAAVLAVARALEHPLMQRASAAAARGECHREAPLTMRDAEGRVMEGVVDLAFRENGVSWIVDYKTDHGAADSLVYRQQLTLYAEALESLTNEPAECVLFLV